MTGRRLVAAVGGAAFCVIAVVALSASGLLAPKVAVAVDGSAQFLAGGLATAACGVTARRRQGMERHWRTFMAIGLAGWTVGVVVWAWARGLTNAPIPTPVLADIGFLMLPILTLPALLTFASVGTPYPGGRGGTARPTARSYAVFVLDGLMVAGSLCLLTWAAATGAVVAAGGLSGADFAVAVVYPVADAVLLTIVVLIASFRRVQQPRQLLLLGLGLVAVSVSDSIYAYLVTSGAQAMHLVADAGFILGPALIGVAALATDRRPAVGLERDHRGFGAWGYLMLPYIPLVLAGVIIVSQTVAGRALDSIELFLGALILVLVVLRQFLTLVDNTALLARVRQTQQRLAYQASHDPLTGLANQRLFEQQLSDAVGLFRSEGRPFGLLYIDLDDFKAINDELGHFAGDTLLQAVAGRLRGCVHSVDLVARLGGDEFAVLLEGDADVSHRVRDRVTATLRRPFAVAGRLRAMHASMGVVIADPTDTDLSPEMLLRRADAAMYSVKRGRKRHTTGARHRIGVDLHAELADALRADAGWPGLDVHYQPIVRIADRGLVAVEALARWTSPTVGVVPPDVFVALAEQGGLVAELDNFVLDRACRELTAATGWRSPPLTLHVNVSATRLDDTELVACVQRALRSYDVPGERLVLEITETSEVPDFDVAADVIARLHRLDVRFALDDFGTGYNTLAHLHRFPVDMVKVDQTFATSADHADATRTNALRQSIVSIARALDVVIVIEGVETEEQAEELSRYGYDLAQGHLYGRPAPLPAALAAPAASRPKKVLPRQQR